MPATLTIRDETTAPGGAPGREDHVFDLTFESESITVRELIRERVYQEVDDHNRAVRAGGPIARFNGLVKPSAAERDLNGDRSTIQRREIDWRTQFDLAIEAFEKNRVLILVGDRQAESLEERIEIGPGTEVTFLRLVLLVGG